ncbi:interferon alpha/beta receptor 2 isoform X2 [Pithys albifrons albifrons]
MKSNNFRHILSWQAGSDPAGPASYTVLYKHHRIPNWVTARQCVGTAQLSCELTQDFQHWSVEYYVFVQSITGTQVFNSGVLRFIPLSHTFLGPPEVNITPCLKCINVTIKVPTSHFREKGKLLSLLDIYDHLQYEITLKSQEEEHKRPAEKITAQVFSTVIEDLYPNRNYCVSVEVSSRQNKLSIPSAWKCVPVGTEPRPGFHVAPVAGAVCVSLIIAAALKCMHAGGYFLQNKSLPHALELIRRLVYSSWILESEETDSVVVVHREVNAPACGGSDSDSDSEGSALWDQDYTRRVTLGRAVPSPEPPAQYSVDSPGKDSGGQAGDSLGTPGMEELPALGGDTDTGGDLLGPPSEGSCAYPARHSSACFTINLQTVLLGTLEGSRDSPAAALPSQEEEGHWECAHGLEAQHEVGTVQKALCGGAFQEWQSSESEESDSAESDTEQLSGYMRR